MDNQAIIVAVSLYGSSADQQPDPIVLRPEDESWRHFSTLMLSLYTSPPSAVNIKYLDDEKDWIDMGSEAEFSEALRMTRTTGEILQVRVLPVSEDGWQDHTYITESLQAGSVSCKDPYKWIPTTDLSYECEERLVYPHPTAPTTQGVMVTSVGGTQYIDAPATQPWLVYPHPNTQPQPQQQVQGLDSEPLGVQTQATNSAAPYPVTHYTPGSNSSRVDNTVLPAPTSRPAVASRTSAPAAAATTGDKTTLLAAATAWQDAAKLPAQDKVKFLKRLVSGSDAESKTGEESRGLNAASNNAVKCNDRRHVSVDSLLKEFVEEPKAAPASKSVWEGQNVQLIPQGQDPFEVDTNVMDQAQLLSEMDNSPTLTPTRISKDLKEEDSTDNSNRQREAEEAHAAFKFAGLSPLTFAQTWPKHHKAPSSTTVTLTSEASLPSTVVRVGNEQSGLPSNPKQPHKEGSSKTKKTKERVACKETYSSYSAKAQVKPPVPLPRALLMMEGAPCGANAVAIEMPAEAETCKSEPGGEEVAASGGAACVAASEETGEILAREGDAAAVSSQIKLAEERECGAGAVVSWETSPVLQVEVQAHKHRKDKSPEKKKKVKDGKSEKKSHKKKPDGEKKSKEDKDKKKDEKKKKEEDKEKKKQSKEENRMKLSEDVESGEKVGVKGDAALQYNDFVKHMRKLKKEMQAGIVRDVTQQTYRIVQTGLFSLSQAELTQAHKEMFSEGVQHVGIYCDNCNGSIIGIRYKCGNCLDFDLCERCEGVPDLHDPTHVFLKLRQPARNAGCAPSSGVGEKYCLLTENIYQVERAETGDPGTPVDLSVQSTGEEQGCKSEASEKERPAVADGAPKKDTIKKEGGSERDKRDYQEYRDLLARCSRESMNRDRQLDGHLGGCSETLNSSSFDLTMARGIDSGMSKIGQEAEERLVAHTGLLPSAPPRQRYRDQDKPSEFESRESCGSSSSDGSSIVQLPTPPDSFITSLPSLEAQAAATGVALSEPSPLNLTTASSSMTDLPLPVASPMIPLKAGSMPLPKYTPLVPLTASSPPEPTPMIPFLPESTPMIPLTAASLPVSTPMIPLIAASFPASTPMVPLRASSLPQSAPMIPLTAATPSHFASSQACHSAAMVPLEATTPAPTLDATPDTDVVDNDKMDEAQQGNDSDDNTVAISRRDSDFEDFVLENCSSSEDDDDDDDDCDENENRKPHLHMAWDSDSSDDFCIIDPESAALAPEGFELLPDSRSLAAALTQSQTVTCDSDVPSANSSPAPSYEEVMSASQRYGTQDNAEDVKVMVIIGNEAETQQSVDAEEPAADVQEMTPLTRSSIEPAQEASTVTTVATVLETEKVESVHVGETAPATGGPATLAESGQEGTACASATVSSVDTGASCDDSAEERRPVMSIDTDVGSGLIHQMSEEEKNRLLELLRMEMGREFILESRRAEAEFRNRELELIGQQAERRREAAVEEVHSSSTASLAGSARRRSLSRSTSESSSIDATAAPPVSSEREARFSRSSSVASSSTRDADCQTVATSQGQDQPSASHIIHNVATGVSKAATSAFLTAKDVFHALQAKQTDWKTPSSSYKPPQSQWKPPADTYRPPANTYKPPTNTYKPPESTYRPPEDTYRPPRDYDDYSDYVPPSANWTLPRSTFIPPNIEWIVGGNGMEKNDGRSENQISAASAGSVSVHTGEEEEATSEARSEQDVTGRTPTVTATESTSVDVALETDCLQREGMQRLVEMGFANREENRRLLAQFSGDLGKVIQALVDGQASDNWAQSRH